MAKVAIRTLDQTQAGASPEGSQGDVRAHNYFDSGDDPLHLHLYEIADGASIRLDAGDAELSIFVWKGSAKAGDTRLNSQASALVEPGASLALSGCDGGATVLVFNQQEGSAAASGEGRVLLLPSEQVPRTDAMGGNEGIGGALHADAHEPTPRVWLHENAFDMPDKETVLHSHSEDEVIFVLKGGIRLGNKLYPEGTALAIAADTKYGFHSGPEGLGFVNFRVSSPTYTSADGSMVLDEAKLWVDMVGKPEYLTLV
ncbi:MAG: hypothetical protein P8J20_01350 [Novosphingobium sp.]|nr:hypothetical protein [Novosphingobium sp.]